MIEKNKTSFATDSHFRIVYLIGGIGKEMARFAIFWYVAVSVNSASVLLIASLCVLFPRILIAPFNQWIISKWTKKTTLVVSEALFTIALLVAAVLSFTRNFSLGISCLFLSLYSLAGFFSKPLLQEVLSIQYQSEQNKYFDVVSKLALSSYPILAALLFSLYEIQGALLVSAAFTSIFFICLISYLSSGVFDEKKRCGALYQKPAYIKAWRLIRTWRGLFILSSSLAVVNALTNPGFVLLPLLVLNYFNKGVFHFALLEFVFNTGVQYGNVLVLRWGGFSKISYPVIAGVMGLGCGLLMIAVAPENLFIISLMGIFITGLMNPFANGPIYALLQLFIPHESLPYVSSILELMSSIIMPLGVGIALITLRIIGVREWIMVGGIVSLAVGVMSFFYPLVLCNQESTG